MCQSHTYMIQSCLFSDPHLSTTTSKIPLISAQALDPFHSHVIGIPQKLEWSLRRVENKILTYLEQY